MTNITEIAKLAGVSRSTVSRVISGNGYVKEEKRKRIEKIIAEVDYIPNQHAILLKKGQTQTIGIIAPSSSEYLAQFMLSFTTIAQKYDYHITFLLANNAKKEIEALEMLRKKQVDGIFMLIRTNEWKVIEAYAKYGPIVTWQRVTSPFIQSVFMDHYTGFQLALHHLFAKGYRTILPLFGSKKGLNTQARYKAWLDFCAQHRLPSTTHELMTEVLDIHDGRALFHWWLAQEKRPEALLFPTDHVAAVFLPEARQQALSVPNEVAVMGFNHSEIAELFNLSTIDYPIASQAENAFLLLYNQLNKTFP